MKRILLLSLLLFAFGLNTKAQTDNQLGNPELQITEEGKRLEATIICLDAIEAPTKYNAFATPFITLPNFPQKLATLSSQALKENIDNYFKSHSELIDKVRSERKKAHDILYGVRPQ